MDDMVYVDICGKIYKVPRQMLEAGPSSRLSRMYKEEFFNSTAECMRINRPKEGFLAILSFYQTSELHMPMTSCPVAFLNELEYWEISPDALSECCFNRLRSYLSDKETVRVFKEQEETSAVPGQTYMYSFLSEYRAKIWRIVDYTKPSFWGKIYFALTILMVLVSIVVMALSTDPNFRRSMTNCERLEYIKASGREEYTDVKAYLEEICDEDIISNNFTHMSGNTIVTIQEKEDNQTETIMFEVIKQYIHDELAPDQNHFNNETNETNFSTDGASSMNDSFTSSFENVSQKVNISVTFQLHRNPLFYINGVFDDETTEINIPIFKVRIFLLFVLDGITTAFFTLDFAIRMSTCPSLRKFIVSVINIADLCSLLGFYSYLGLFHMFPHLRYGSWIDNLAYIQMLRSLRFFRIAVNVRAGKVMWYSARKNMKDLSVLALFLIMGMVTFASCFYITEQDNTVNSMTDTWYWAIITMTTVGYGDIQPESKVGRLIACVAAVSGVLVLAVTVPIFANHFLLLYQYAESENVVMKIQNCQNKTNSCKNKKNRGWKNIGNKQ